MLHTTLRFAICLAFVVSMSSMPPAHAQSDAQLMQEAFDTTACFSADCPSQILTSDHTEENTSQTYNSKPLSDRKVEREVDNAIDWVKFLACEEAKEGAALLALTTPCINADECELDSFSLDDECTYDVGEPDVASIATAEGFKLCLDKQKGYGRSHDQAVIECNAIAAVSKGNAIMISVSATATATARQFCKKRECALKLPVTPKFQQLNEHKRD